MFNFHNSIWRFRTAQWQGLLNLDLIRFRWILVHIRLGGEYSPTSNFALEKTWNCNPNTEHRQKNWNKSMVRNACILTWRFCSIWNKKIEGLNFLRQIKKQKRHPIETFHKMTDVLERMKALWAEKVTIRYIFLGYAYFVYFCTCCSKSLSARTYNVTE